MTMKAFIILLLISTPFALGRLGDTNERVRDEQVKTVQETDSEEMFYATNEIVPMYSSETNQTVDPKDFDDSFPFALESADEVISHHKHNVTIAPKHSRELSASRSVTIWNLCDHADFFLAMYYREWETGDWVHRGWYSVPSGHRVEFHDVMDGDYNMYAISHDRRYEWNADPSEAQHCFNGRCYMHYSYPNSNSFQYLSCNGPAPTPAPVAAPTPVPEPLSYREQQWVNAHNSRRQTFHSQNGKSYVPLQWSRSLAQSAQGYADLLATVTTTECYTAHGYQGNSYGGENIASNWGGTSYTFEDPESVLTRWFENEEYDQWPQNGHRTQVAWRATNYVGCGEARRLYDGNRYCMIQVCRYISPGNCNVGSKPLDELMMDDDSPCSPRSPSS